MRTPDGSFPPRGFGPSALAGLGGGATPFTPPPIPGQLHAPTLAAAPPLKESDLRAMTTLFSETFGVGTPVSLAGGVEQVPTPSVDAPAPPQIPGSAAPFGSVPSLDALPGLDDFPSGAPYSFPLVEPAPPSAPDAGEPGLYFLEHRGLPRETDVAPGAASPSAEVRPRPGSGPGLFDAASVKRDFPILEERVHGKPLVWLDNAATTQKPRAVIERLSYFYEHENSNVHRAAHALAARSTDAYEAAREKVRRFVNAPSTKEIVWVRGTTEGINLVAKSWGKKHVGPGDEILITWLEHHANIVPWQMLARETGARLRVAPVDDTGQIILEDFDRLLTSRTKIVSLSQVSNALGTITPAKQMVDMAHRRGARVLVDGAQSVSHLPTDVQALDCDFFCFSGHKVFGPTGIGVVYGKPEVLADVPPWQGGGNMIADVTFERTVYQPPPYLFEAGTGNIADAVGLGAAIDYVERLGLPNIARYEHDLLEYGTEHLLQVPGLRLIGTAAEKAGVLSFVLDGTPTEEVGKALDQEGIAVRAGHHCAQPILRRFGLEQTVRASLAPYNTCEDIDALVAALHRIQAGRPQVGIVS